MITVAQALAAAQALGLDRLDAQWLLSHQLQQGRAWLVAHDDHVLAADQAAAFQAHCLRRADGEPLAYLTGERGFHGLSLQVTPAVLVPRPDTETLVDWALEMDGLPENARVIDLGTGSGAIACPETIVVSGIPVNRATASAAKTALTSWRVSTTLIPSCLHPCKIGEICPPHKVKSACTPCFLRQVAVSNPPSIHKRSFWGVLKMKYENILLNNNLFDSSIITQKVEFCGKIQSAALVYKCGM